MRGPSIWILPLSAACTLLAVCVVLYDTQQSSRERLELTEFCRQHLTRP